MSDLDLSILINSIQKAASSYHRLVLLVAPINSGKTAMLRSLGNYLGARLINLNLELSQRMLELTERQRKMQLSDLLLDVVTKSRDESSNSDVIVFDNTELLFDSGLGHDPLRLLQNLARSQMLVVSWNGEVRDGYITYAVPGHRDYRRYPTSDLVVVNLT